ncbi:hypothetical protein BDZ94DRAFT_1314585 [Collybia nuda]|uniref:Uncharacterized protein n=1 Tax=Collybia nuda TaxID=64659 RepID=A0A9P5XUM6_9AGAR|nr:hypothetical protein BDZ94DRAFT_1314585 [Collybia nuda]
MAPEANNLPPPCPSLPLILPFNDGFDAANILDPLIQCVQGPGNGGLSVHSHLLPHFALAEDLSEPTDLLEPCVPLLRQQIITPQPGSPQHFLTNQTPVLSTPAIAGPCPLTTPHEHLPLPPMTLVNAPPEDGLTSVTGEKRHSISPPPSPIAKQVKNVPPPVKLPAKRTLRSITSTTAPEPAGCSQRKCRVPASKEVITLAEKQARAVKETGAPMRKRACK